MDRGGLEWVKELRMIADAAAPGPWFVGCADDDLCQSAGYVSTEKVIENRWPDDRSVVAITFLQMPSYACNALSEENEIFIAAARTGVPRLCDALEQSLKDRAALVSVLREVLDASESPGRAPKLEQSFDRARQLIEQF